MATVIILDVISHNDFTGPGITSKEDQKRSRDQQWQERNAVREENTAPVAKKPKKVCILSTEYCIHNMNPYLYPSPWYPFPEILKLEYINI